MNLRTLEYIIAVAELKHFGKASEHCHVSQPTLSMQIRKFEELHNITLFERTPRNIRLTRAGEDIVAEIKKLLSAYQRIETIAKASEPAIGELYLGAFPTLAPFYLPKIMPVISRHFPKLKCYLIEDRSPALLQQLQTGKLDAALLALPLVVPEDFVVFPLFTEPLLAAIPADHPLAKRKSLRLAHLKDEPLLLLEDGHCLSGQALEVCTWAGITRRHDFRATSIETLRQMVGSGLGMTLIPQIAVDKNQNNVKYLPLKEKKAVRHIGLVTRKSHPNNDFIGNLANILKNS